MEKIKDHLHDMKQIQMTFLEIFNGQFFFGISREDREQCKTFRGVIILFGKFRRGLDSIVFASLKGAVFLLRSFRGEGGFCGFQPQI